MSDEVDAAAPNAGSAASIVSVWFDRHVDTIHGYVARRAGWEVAREVTATTFRLALEQFDSFDARRGGERGWLYGIASNVLRHHWRDEQRRLRAYLRHGAGEFVAVDPLLAVDARVDAQRRLARIIGAIELLEPADRDLLLLVAWERCTSAEVAVALDIPASTVRRRLQRIRAELRRMEGNRS